VVGGVEIVGGYLVAWPVSKARRAGAQLNRDVHLIIGTELDRLHNLMAARLRLDSALQKLELAVAAAGEVSDRTRRRAC
jgi:hypothetical protein